MLYIEVSARVCVCAVVRCVFCVCPVCRARHEKPNAAPEYKAASKISTEWKHRRKKKRTTPKKREKRKRKKKRTNYINTTHIVNTQHSSETIRNISISGQMTYKLIQRLMKWKKQLNKLWFDVLWTHNVSLFCPFLRIEIIKGVVAESADTCIKCTGARARIDRQAAWLQRTSCLNDEKKKEYEWRGRVKNEKKLQATVYRQRNYCTQFNENDNARCGGTAFTSQSRAHFSVP